MPSLVDVVDQLHQDNCIWHFPSSIVQDGVNIPLVVTDQRDVQPARSCWLLFHQQEDQEQRAVELKRRNALLGVTLVKGPRVRWIASVAPVQLDQGEKVRKPILASRFVGISFDRILKTK